MRRPSSNGCDHVRWTCVASYESRRLKRHDPPMIRVSEPRWITCTWMTALHLDKGLRHAGQIDANPPREHDDGAGSATRPDGPEYQRLESSATVELKNMGF